jgi:hypothetical protein
MPGIAGREKVVAATVGYFSFCRGRRIVYAQLHAGFQPTTHIRVLGIKKIHPVFHNRSHFAYIILATSE